MNILQKFAFSKMLVPFREPTDMTSTVAKISDSLFELASEINSLHENASSKVVVEPSLIKAIVDALKELNEERLWLHETLESETITASVLRHKLYGFPRDIESEVRGAVKSARNSNSVQLQSLKDQLQVIEACICDLEHRFEILTVSNVALYPEKQQLMSQHSTEIGVLNQVLSERASMQIRLNETREKLRDTYKKTADYKEALVEIGIDMIEERKEAAEEGTRLDKDIIVAQDQVDLKSKENDKLIQDLESTQQILSSKTVELEKLKHLVRYHDTSRLKYETQCAQLSEELRNEIAENALLGEVGAAVLHETAEFVDKSKSIEQDLTKKLSELSVEVGTAKAEYDRLQLLKMKISAEYDSAKLSGNRDKDEAEEMANRLRFVKDDLLHQTSECARLKRENTDLEVVIEKAIQDHAATAEILGKQIENSLSALTAERQERLNLQKKREEIARQSADFIAEYDQFVSTKTRLIRDGKADHQSLLEQGASLQASLKNEEEVIMNQQKQLKQAKDEFVLMQSSLTAEINAVQSSIASLSEEVRIRTENYQQAMPSFRELEQRYEKETEEFERAKKRVVEFKTLKAQLEKDIDEINERIVKMEEPKLKVQEGLTSARKEYLELLRQQGEEILQLELLISSNAEEVLCISRENERFHKANAGLLFDIDDMADRMAEMREGKLEREVLIDKYKAWLEKQWTEDKKLTQECHDRDVLMIDDIEDIRKFATERGDRVERIHSSMSKQIELLTDYLDKVIPLRRDVCEEARCIPLS